jgi:hypothetical protein
LIVRSSVRAAGEAAAPRRLIASTERIALNEVNLFILADVELAFFDTMHAVGLALHDIDPTIYANFGGSKCESNSM